MQLCRHGVCQGGSCIRWISRGDVDERVGAIVGELCTVCSCRISSSKLTVPGRASVIRSWLMISSGSHTEFTNAAKQSGHRATMHVLFHSPFKPKLAIIEDASYKVHNRIKEFRTSLRSLSKAFTISVAFPETSLNRGATCVPTRRFA